MTTRIILAGATGWVGKALVAAIAASDDLQLVGAVARNAAGRDAGEAAGLGPWVCRSARRWPRRSGTPCDVVIDYTKPDAVKNHALQALAVGVTSWSGLQGSPRRDYAEVDAAAQMQGRGVLAAGNFSITATLMRRFALEAARYVPDVEIIDYASPKKADTPSGTGRELAELLAQVRQPGTAKPVGELSGVRETRGGAIGGPTPVQVHSAAHALVRAVLRGRARRRQRAPDDPPRRRRLGCALRGRHASGRPPGRRLRRTEARARRGDGVSARPVTTTDLLNSPLSPSSSSITSGPISSRTDLVEADRASRGPDLLFPHGFRAQPHVPWTWPVFAWFSR
jgi:4-hydroxy-tetrahydrodipicolinate reductase